MKAFRQLALGLPLIFVSACLLAGVLLAPVFAWMRLKF